MTYYKFLRHNDVSYLVSDGSVQFGRLEYFQLLEKVTGDDWIGDIGESTATTSVTTVVDGSSPDFHQHPLSGLMSGPGKMIFEGAKFISFEDRYVFCLADGNFDQLLATMSKTRNDKLGYDACLEVNLPELISQLGDVEYEGLPLIDQFEIQPRKVNYLPPVREDFASTGSIVSGDPFEKHVKYSEQQEYRIVLKPRPGVKIEKDNIRLIIADPELVFKECPTNIHLPYQDEPKPTLEALHTEVTQWIKNFGPSSNVRDQKTAMKQFVQYYWQLRYLSGEVDLSMDMAIKFESGPIESIMWRFERYLENLLPSHNES